MHRAWSCTNTFTASAVVALLFAASAYAQNPDNKEKSPADKPDPALSAFAESAGLFAGLQLYNTYLNIGILADAMAEELYPSADVYQLLGSVVHPLERVEKQLAKITALKLPKEDADAVAKLTRIAGLLRQQGKELELYWDKGLPEHSKRYEATRQAAWKELSALLELEPKNEKLPEPKLTTTPKKP